MVISFLELKRYFQKEYLPDKKKRKTNGRIFSHILSRLGIYSYSTIKIKPDRNGALMIFQVVQFIGYNI